MSIKFTGAFSPIAPSTKLKLITLVPTYSLIAFNTVSLDEDGITVANCEVYTQNMPNGTQVGYTISGAGITAGDISTGSLTGVIDITNNYGSFSFSAVEDSLTEGEETLTVTLDGTDSNGYLTGSLSANLIINDTSTLSAGQTLYNTAGTYSYIVPDGVTSICVVAVGGGGSGAANAQSGSTGTGAAGGNGADLRYRNFISVTPGETLTVTVGAGGAKRTTNATAGIAGGSSSLYREGTALVIAAGGRGGVYSSTAQLSNSGSTSTGGNVGGGAGGLGGKQGSGSERTTGGGGAGGYAGSGGNGSGYNQSATNGAGGGGGGGSGSLFSSGNVCGAGGGGGVGLYGQGANGTTSGGVNSVTLVPGGNGGSGGVKGQNGLCPNTSTAPSYLYSGYGGAVGGGGAGIGDFSNNVPSFDSGAGGTGGVRIIFGNNRFFPSTNTANI